MFLHTTTDIRLSIEIPFPDDQFFLYSDKKCKKSSNTTAKKKQDGNMRKVFWTKDENAEPCPEHFSEVSFGKQLNHNFSKF